MRKFLIAALLILCVPPCYAQPVTHVEMFNSGGTTIFSQDYTAGAAITLPILANARRIMVFNIPQSSDMGAITLTGSPSGSCWVYFARTEMPGTAFYTLTSAAACNNLGSVSVTGSNTQVKVYALQTISGGVSARWLASLQAGAIQSAVNSSVGDTFVKVGSSSATGDITVASGQLAVEATTGDLAGDCVASAGNIGTIQASGNILGNVSASGGDIAEVLASGTIGTSTAPVSITTSGNGSDIGTVRGSSVYATITTSNQSSPRGDTKRIEATAGVFKGSLTTYVMQGTALGTPAIDLATNLDANVDVFATWNTATCRHGLLTRWTSMATRRRTRQTWRS